jgi:hypothetical protein
MALQQRARGLSGQTLGDRDQLNKGRGVWGMPHVGKGHHGFAWGRRIGGSLARGARLDPGEAKVDEDITMTTTTPAAPPHQAPLPSLAGPITRARARDLNFVMLLKNEGPEE